MYGTKTRKFYQPNEADYIFVKSKYSWVCFPRGIMVAMIYQTLGVMFRLAIN